MSQAQIPPKLWEYLRRWHPSAEHPIIAQEYCPGRGWVSQSYRKRISRSWARKLRAQGVTHVALNPYPSARGSRVRIDFSIKELIR